MIGIVFHFEIHHEVAEVETCATTLFDCKASKVDTDEIQWFIESEYC